jgi:hypothetical protein
MTSVPRDERLLAEFRGLRREEFVLGAKWRVVDSTRRLHRELSVSLAGACLLVGNDDTEDLMLVSDTPGRAWQDYLARGGSRPQTRTRSRWR